MFRRKYRQDKFFESSDPDNPHPWYGPCDLFGPDQTCAECQGVVGRDDGSIATLDGVTIARPRLSIRLRRAWHGFMS